MIEFSYIRMKNFFSVGNYPVEINLNTHKKTLVVGKNGASKSSCILDSIVFALYGKPFRKLVKPNIVNSINKSNLLVEIEFTISKKRYKVIRGIKPNIFEIYCNDKLVNQDAKSKDYQEYLEKYILKTNYKSFINVVILGSARYIPFMQMTAADRRSIIEELLDIQIFSTMNTLLKDKVSKLKEESNKIEYQIDLINEKIKLQKSNIEDHKNNIKDQIKEKHNEIEKSNGQIEKYQEDIIKIQKHIDILIEQIKDKSSLEKKKQSLITMENKLDSNIKKIKKEEDFYNNHSNCSTCKQPIDDEFKKIQLERGNKKIIELNTGLDKLNSDLGKVKLRLKEIEKINDNIIKHQNEIIKLNASISTIQRYIQKEIKSIGEISNIERIEITNEKLIEMKSELEIYLKTQEDLNNTKKYYEFSQLLLKDGGIKTKIIKQYLPILNKLINTYLSKMNFFVNFNINENFEEIIKSRYRDEFRYENFSEGEKLRIDLSILFAFRQIAKMKNSINTNLLIMDEILDTSIDKEGIEIFLEMLNSIDSNIFIISHKEEQISDHFDRVLKFQKKKNFTKMIELKVK